MPQPTSAMFEVSVSGGRVLLKPVEVQLGGYGRGDVLVYRGAPVAIDAVERRLREAGIDAKLRIEDSVLILEVKAEYAEKAVQIIEEMLRNAARDLAEFEEVVRDAVRSYMEKYG